MENNTWDILKKYDLGSFLDYELYEKFSKVTDDEKEIIDKILEYKNYEENNKNKYSEKIMQYLRQREGLDKYDFSKDKELSEMSSNEVFSNVVRWNGLLGGYEDTIKEWIKDIYKVDLDNVK